jgi:probable phosphoglycerate mutase
MTLLAVLRHAPTDWNRARRLQGRADVPLSDESRAKLRGLRLPAEVAGYTSLVSPLQRCRETAQILGLKPRLDARLIEMDWGNFEGRTLAELRETHGPTLAANEHLGLDFQPPGGESPRTVQARVAPLLGEIAAAGAPTIAVTHRGVIRAIYAQARNWDMTGESPDEFDLYALHLFRLSPSGAPTIERLNVALEAA